MSDITTGQELAKAIAGALGLDADKVNFIKLTISANCALTVEVMLFSGEKALAELPWGDILLGAKAEIKKAQG